MTLLQIFKALTYGELKQLDIGNFEPDEFESEPDPKVYEQLMHSINLGLTEIYKRFFLSSKEIYIEQSEEIEEYFLHSDYAQSNTASTEPVKYIADSASNPFQDDVLKIEQCYDEEGNLLFLNDWTEDLSIFTPSYKSLQVPWPNEFDTIAVQYRADHPDVIYTRGMDPALIEVAIPNSLQEALLLYVASRSFGPMDGDQGATKSSYLQQFNASCDQVKLLGLHIQGEPGIWRFDQAGWV